MQVLENVFEPLAEWLPSEAFFLYSPQDKVWKAREDFRNRYLQKKVVFGILSTPLDFLYFCGEQLATLGNFYGFNLLEATLSDVPDLCKPLESGWIWDAEKKSLYARSTLRDAKRTYDVDIFRQYPPMGTGPAWRLDRFSCEQKHKFLFYTIHQGKRVCPRCLV